jgi:hypothetical protein
MAGFQIKRCPDVVEAAAAARFIGARVALLRSAANDLGPGARFAGKDGRCATYLGVHPHPDYGGADWWQLQQSAPGEVG